MDSSQSINAIDEEALDQLRDLLHMNVDSRDGFAYAGKRLADMHSSLAMRFHRYSQERNDFCERLKQFDEVNYSSSNSRGVVAASLRLTWMDLRDKLDESVDVSAVVAEAHRGESYALQGYASAIETVMDPRLIEELKIQYESIMESYVWLSGLMAEDQRQSAKDT